VQIQLLSVKKSIGFEEKLTSFDGLRDSDSLVRHRSFVKLVMSSKPATSFDDICLMRDGISGESCHAEPRCVPFSMIEKRTPEWHKRKVHECLEIKPVTIKKHILH
jgi:hypothetical protein